jgi:hypothetical protein
VGHKEFGSLLITDCTAPPTHVVDHVPPAMFSRHGTKPKLVDCWFLQANLKGEEWIAICRSWLRADVRRGWQENGSSISGL